MARADELDWDDLRYFLSAAQAKTLAGAARAVGVEHSTIGRRLSALERSLGAALVLRGSEGVTLTPLGQQVLPLIEEIQRVVLSVRDLVAQQKARVRLAMPTGLVQLFTARLDRLQREHPGISLELLSGSRPVDLKKGEADLAVRTGVIADPDLVARKLGVSGFSLYASDAYLARCGAPVDPSDLSGHDVIGFDQNVAATPPAKWLAEHGAGANIVLRSREMIDVATAAASGVGLALLPCLLGDAEKTLIRLTPEVLVTHPLRLVYRREARLAAPVRVVMEFVVNVFKEHAHRISGTVDG
jgi:DNA-binding transcriptional LysR family regulator